MPNKAIDPSLHKAFADAFGGSTPTAVPQQAAPTPPSPEGSGVGSSLYGALFGESKPTELAPDPYMNAAKVLTGRK